MKHRVYPQIRTPEDLGVACLGDPRNAIVPPKRSISRADYGRRLAAAEGGVFTPSGYRVPMKRRGRKAHAE